MVPRGRSFQHGPESAANVKGTARAAAETVKQKRPASRDARPLAGRTDRAGMASRRIVAGTAKKQNETGKSGEGTHETSS